MANRLFVTSLKSIGLVAAGDNPESEVVIFKSRNSETVAEWSARTNRRLADVRKTLEDLDKRISNRRPSRLATIPERNPMTMTEKETPQDLNELVIAKLDAYARAAQFEGEIAGKYGYLSTPREEMVTKIRAKWWATPDGQAVKDLVRERAAETPPTSPRSPRVTARHTPPSADSMAEASGGNGVVSSLGLIKREIPSTAPAPRFVRKCPVMS